MTGLTDSHVLIALVQASASIPIMLFGVFAGAIADNYDRRRIMLLAQAGMLLVSTVLAVLTWADAIGPILLIALTLAVGTGTALNAPAWQASVRAQVGPEDITQAISLGSISFNLARSVGPAIGGLLISFWSTEVAFAANALSYLGMIVVLARWNPPIAQRRRTGMLPAIAAGMSFCRRSSAIRKILLRGLAFGFGAAGYQALLPSIARDLLRGSEVDYGLMLGAFGMGSIAVAFWISALRRRFGSEAVVSLSTVVFLLAQVLIARADNLAGALPAAFLAGAGWVGALTSLNVAMQFRSPEAILGRCLSIYQAVTFGGMALGAWAWGAVADSQGLSVALDSAAAWLTLTLGFRWIAPMPQRDEGRVEVGP